ncbi:MAG: cyclase family protein [Bacteroidetes bacterium]|nr:MAG: cyclase family protein [Bacteroidota bacterium]
MKLFLDDHRFIDTEEGIDLSISLSNDEQNPRAWYVDKPRFEPVRANGFLGSVAEGGNVNFRDIFFNPHGHGTHTECLGHITEEVYNINDSLKTFFFQAILITLRPEKRGEDLVISKKQLEDALDGRSCEALIVRTLPNEKGKLHRDYSNTNPPYFDPEGVQVLDQAGVKHLLVDLPSVDREEDGGTLIFHHTFWKVPEAPRFDRTITELIYVNDYVVDGAYILNLQISSFKNDASPSKPILYKITS